MDITFSNTVFNSLKPVLSQVASEEQTQEMRLPEGMPDVGRVISAWGQCVVRSKEWNIDTIQCAAGMMIWVLYAPENGSAPQMINTWIPFQFRWELPDGTPEGKLLVQCLTRFADARSVSPRKIMIRCGMSALIQAYVSEKTTVASAEKEWPGIEVLNTKYPVRIQKEAGEKVFQLDEELSVPESAPKPDGIIYCAVSPCLLDCRVLTDKLAFRGEGKLHILYRSQEGQLHSWDFSVPFSQYTLLDEHYGSDAQAETFLCITGLEAEVQENGMFRVKCGIVCQYLISDRQMLEIAEDAYSLKNELDLQRISINPNTILERRSEKLHPEQSVNAEVNIVPDVAFLPDFPRTSRIGEEMKVLWPGYFQVLFYGADGQLYASTARWEGEWKTTMDSNVFLRAIPGQPEVHAVIGSGAVSLSAELPVAMEVSTEQSLSMITGIQLGQAIKRDTARPSLILKRAGEQSLWELARNCGSTREAIRTANALSGEPAVEQMLLIPVL